jgi:uncharacterized protein YciI
MTGEKLFAVIRTRGPCWNDAEAMEGQQDWRRHADQMNAMVADGFMVLGGPLVGTREVLLIVRAADEAEIEARLGADCWTINGLLRTLQVRPWWLRLGSVETSLTARP